MSKWNSSWQYPNNYTPQGKDPLYNPQYRGYPGPEFDAPAASPGQKPFDKYGRPHQGSGPPHVPQAVSPALAPGQKTPQAANPGPRVLPSAPLGGPAPPMLMAQSSQYPPLEYNYGNFPVHDQWEQLALGPRQPGQPPNPRRDSAYDKQDKPLPASPTDLNKDDELPPMPTQLRRLSTGGKVAKRSRMGCLTCRQRKKRCCEARPKCTECHRLRLNCVWPKPGTEHKNKPKEVKSQENMIDHDVYGKIKVLRGIVEYRSD